MKKHDKNTGRTPDGRWVPGASANPEGRPQGTSPASRLRALLDPHAPDLIGKAVELAKAGDTTALRICLERILPALKPADEPLLLEGLGQGDLAARAGAVLNALGTGQLTPEQATSAIRALATYSEITLLGEMEKRIERLESAKGGQK